MNLLIDSGNSFIKWRLSEGARSLPYNRCETGLVASLHDAWKNHETPSRVIVANVAGEHIASEIRKTVSGLWHLKPEFVNSNLQCCGLTNSYHKPEQLGVDRWMAMVAACQTMTGPVVIVDCGTAVTIDLVNQNKQFAGGVIMPGLHSFFHGLMADTDVVKESGRSNAYTGPFARSTEEGVTAGVMLGITGGIEKVILALSSGLDAPPVVYITGGDAEKLLPHLAVKCIYQASLVLDGLRCYAEATETPGSAGC